MVRLSRPAILGFVLGFAVSAAFFCTLFLLRDGSNLRASEISVQPSSSSEAESENPVNIPDLAAPKQINSKTGKAIEIHPFFMNFKSGSKSSSPVTWTLPRAKDFDLPEYKEARKYHIRIHDTFSDL